MKGPIILTRNLLSGLIGLALLSASPAAAQSGMKVIVDTDLGDDIDDAFALAWVLANPEFNVLAVTTAWGDTALRDRMARRILDIMGRKDMPIGHGLETKNSTPFTQANWAKAGPERKPADAVGMMIELAARYPGEITLVALAPLSNIGAFIDRDPAAFRNLKSVVLMSGSVERGYNSGNGAIAGSQPSAEYNAAMDPASLRKLLSSGVPVTLFPLDSTQIKFQETERTLLLGSGGPLGEMLSALYQQWRLHNIWGQITPTLFDVVPLAWLLDPETCPAAPMHLIVKDDGRTVAEPGKPNVSVCLAGRDADIIAAMTTDLLNASGDK